MAKRKTTGAGTYFVDHDGELREIPCEPTVVYVSAGYTDETATEAEKEFTAFLADQLRFDTLSGLLTHAQIVALRVQQAAPPQDPIMQDVADVLQYSNETGASAAAGKANEAAIAAFHAGQAFQRLLVRGTAAAELRAGKKSRSGAVRGGNAKRIPLKVKQTEADEYAAAYRELKRKCPGLTELAYRERIGDMFGVSESKVKQRLRLAKK